MEEQLSYMDELFTLPAFTDNAEQQTLYLKALQEELTINPNKGDLIQGTGGLRKIRVAFEGKGKSGGARVCYVDFAVCERIYLITAYTKNEKDNLSKEERNNVKKLVEYLKKSIDRR